MTYPPQFIDQILPVEFVQACNETSGLDRANVIEIAGDRQEEIGSLFEAEELRKAAAALRSTIDRDFVDNLELMLADIGVWIRFECEHSHCVNNDILTNNERPFTRVAKEDICCVVSRNLDIRTINTYVNFALTAGSAYYFIPNFMMRKRASIYSLHGSYLSYNSNRLVSELDIMGRIREARHGEDYFHEWEKYHMNVGHILGVCWYGNRLPVSFAQSLKSIVAIGVLCEARGGLQSAMREIEERWPDCVTGIRRNAYTKIGCKKESGEE